MARTASTSACLMAGSPPFHNGDVAGVRWARYASPKPLMTSMISALNVVPPPIRGRAVDRHASPTTIRPRRRLRVSVAFKHRSWWRPPPRAVSRGSRRRPHGRCPSRRRAVPLATSDGCRLTACRRLCCPIGDVLPEMPQLPASCIESSTRSCSLGLSCESATRPVIVRASKSTRPGRSDPGRPRRPAGSVRIVASDPARCRGRRYGPGP